MCGIAGLYYPAQARPADPARIAQMGDAQAHRGPDGSGVWTAAGVGLGHRRLAIGSGEGRAQPMATPDQALVVVHDGEIYNYREIRAELEALGARFAGDSDTEILLHGWRLWGARMLDRLDGAFAFALYDAGKRSLFLARDRFGEKPLHYAELSDGAVAFASELKGLLAHPLFRRTADFRAVEDYLALGYVPDDASMLAGVRKLPAGHFLLLERGKPIPQPVRWWDLDFCQRASGKIRDLEAELLDHMRRAIRARMAADAPLGALLSGEADSSAVVALMAEASKAAVKTSTSGFGEGGRDAIAQAAIVAARFATSHRARAVASDDFALIDTLVAAFDEPFADAAALPGYRACALAREQVAVVLSGEGADEVFAGHRRYRSFAAEERIRASLPAGLRASAFGALGRLYPGATLLALAGSGGSAYSSAVAVTARAQRERLYSPAARKALGGHTAEGRYIDAMREAPARDALDRAQYADIRHSLPGNVLTRTDRTSMAVGLAVRAPLLDHRLVQFAATLPPALRIRAGQGKWLMKKALAPYLPREILYGPKTGSAVPVSAWFRTALADEAAGLARSHLLASTGWFDLKTIETLAADHKSGRAEHGRTLWQLLMLERSLSRLFP